MRELFSRTELLLGSEAMTRLEGARVAVFGVGGVGGYAVEALARCGVGALDLIDSDTVSESNINRQIIATLPTVGRLKVDVAAERIRSIHPDCCVRMHPVFYLPQTEGMFDLSAYDYVIDAVDTVAAKLALITNAKRAGTPIICSMGAGNKMDPTAFRVADIADTSVCPLARVLRAECRRRGLHGVKVVYSQEPPITPTVRQSVTTGEGQTRRDVPGSVSFVPSVVGLILASEVVKDLIGWRGGAAHVDHT